LRQRIAQRGMQLPRLIDDLAPEEPATSHDNKCNHETQQNPAHSIPRSECADADGFAPPQQETDHPTPHFATRKGMPPWSLHPRDVSVLAKPELFHHEGTKATHEPAHLLLRAFVSSW
jgi:hypothetical protein